MANRKNVSDTVEYVGSEVAAAAAAEPGFDALLEEAEAIARRLEDGDLPLEEALRLYEVGVARLRAGSAVLARTEKKLKRLVEEAGGFRLDDFVGDDANPADPAAARTNDTAEVGDI